MTPNYTIVVVTAMLFAWAIVKTIVSHFSNKDDNELNRKKEFYRIDMEERVKKYKIDLLHENGKLRV